ncbi:phenylacetic acid degradation protein paaI [Streptococcus criceti]|uniref:Acyl-coenzyme A thioesterase PaaI family protein n=1 Tax=Streptococcus criceti HS-6 TaxID=873449 RepID=G5JMI4_STRCG|nr:PaaI family thioesterase [Streptococcus criceti]EHI74800.1 acyl-coenzyme A thioesterase PaaI family protein [Streptococcus criceti HS-6]SUN37810.1 phenylacetic acid degradation protein paaI [Streptococcus criceti]
MKENYIHEIKAFENHQLDSFDYGHVVVTSDIVQSSLNYYGQAHGGYLFTLCDQISGLTAISTGSDAVTLQSSINYIKPGNLGDKLTIEGSCTHDGRTTKVIDVTINNQDRELVAKASFTMYVTGQHKEETIQ